MSVANYTAAFQTTVRLFAIVLLLGLLSYAANEVGYNDATIFFAVCTVAITVVYLQQFKAELAKHRAE